MTNIGTIDSRANNSKFRVTTVTNVDHHRPGHGTSSPRSLSSSLPVCTSVLCHCQSHFGTCVLLAPSLERLFRLALRAAPSRSLRGTVTGTGSHGDRDGALCADGPPAQALQWPAHTRHCDARARAHTGPGALAHTSAHTNTLCASVTVALRHC